MSALRIAGHAEALAGAQHGGARAAGPAGRNSSTTNSAIIGSETRKLPTQVHSSPGK